MLHSWDEISDKELEGMAAVGERIAAILDSSDFKSAVNFTRAELFAEWENGEDVAAREEAHGTLKGLGRLIESFEKFRSDGQAAQKTIRQREKKQQ